MTTYYSLKESIEKLETFSSDSQEEKLFQMLKEYLNLFPVLNAHLFRYSPIGYFAEGIILVDSEGLHHIGDVRDDIRTLPVVYPAIQQRRAKYFSGMEYFKRMTRRYLISKNVNSIVVVPIVYRSIVIGYICSDQINEHACIDETLLQSFTNFGKLAGDFIFQAKSFEDSPLLSRRELEVMKRISWGESIKEMASKMNITESTVKQYIKTAIRKLGAKNRSHAVSELFRMGIIT